MAQDRNTRGRVERFIEALHRVEHTGESAVNDLVALFAPEARVINPILRRVEDERRGGEGLRGFWSEYATVIGRSESQFLHVTVGDAAAGLFWTTHQADGRHYDGATLLEFDAEGRITLLRAYFDPEDLDARRRAA